MQKMTENQKELKIAFYVDKYSHKGFKVQEVWSGSGAYIDTTKLIDNKEFQATLSYGGFTRGRSALNIEWIDHDRKLIYYSGMSLLDGALLGGEVEGNKISGTFCFKKQGTSILLQKSAKEKNKTIK